MSVVVEQTEKAGTQEDSQSQIVVELIIRQTRPARAMISAELQVPSSSTGQRTELSSVFRSKALMPEDTKLRCALALVSSYHIGIVPDPLRL